MKNIFQKGKSFLVALLIAIIVFVLTYSQALYSWDKLLADPIYQQPSTPDNTIRLITIDERTIAEYGEFFDWSRDIPAKLVELLNENPDKAPAVIAFDIMYTSERDKETDERFAEACKKAGNVITAVNLVYRTELTNEGGSLKVDNDHVSMVEYSYPALKEAVGYGFANTYLDKDQFVRFARLKADYNGETIYSFPARIYLKYAKYKGFVPVFPKTDKRQMYNFTYTGKSGSYETLSLCDVLDGRIDPEVFAGTILLVGAYVPGLQDHYNVAVQHGSQMYGVEIQANILEALLEGNTGLPVNDTLYAAVVAIVLALYFLVIRKLKIVPAALTGIGLIGLHVVMGIILYRHGMVVRIIEPVLGIVVVYVLYLIGGYLSEILKKRKILNAFKKYVAPQVVQEVADKGDFRIELGGERRHVAVLFVDIRGFTPMSEGLEPDKIVEILNEYLALTTSAIFKNGGTLDKFIGDATMAVFNAPFDLDDYIYRAVCTARDIAAGSEELEKRLMERFGKSVSFGVGVNCGEAVVGNIGCEFRMDYTAIGDTVNTAARLESNAKRGQILISEAVYERVKERVKVTEVGVIPLKGKSNDVFVYQLDEGM